MILYSKFALRQPLNRQSDEYAREGIDLPLSTLADYVGECTAILQPLHHLLQAHVFAGERIHGDDTPVPLLAKIKTKLARLWTYVRDDRPFVRQRSTRSNFLLLARSPGRSSRTASGALWRDFTSRRVRRLFGLV
jgi:hypothetical protein